MKTIFFFTLLASFSAFSQTSKPTEYVVLPSPPSFFTPPPKPELKIDRKLTFKDTDRATIRLNDYFSRPVDLYNIYPYRNSRYAYQPTAFDMVNVQIQHDIFPEVKW